MPKRLLPGTGDILESTGKSIEAFIQSVDDEISDLYRPLINTSLAMTHKLADSGIAGSREAKAMLEAVEQLKGTILELGMVMFESLDVDESDWELQDKT